MTNENVEKLKSNLNTLSEGDKKFASSLLNQLDKRGTLSDKQWPWIAKLADRAVAGPPKQKTATIGSMTGLVELLAAAGTNLKYPKIRLVTDNGLTILLGKAGPKSKFPGTINIAGPGSFYDRIWYGRVTVDGEFNIAHRIDDKAADDVSAILSKMSNDPAGTAAAYGKTTGSCCFCAKTLTDERSTDVGYGPVCAGNYSLPWGTK